MPKITVKCENAQKVLLNITQFEKKIVRNLISLTRMHLQEGAVLLKTKYLSGAGPSSIGIQTGKLRKTVKVIPPEITPEKITGGISVGDETTPYAGVHIGSPKGKETVIKPKKAKMLAIPMPYAKTAIRGVPRGKPTDPIWGVTFIADNMIWGFKRGTSREYAKPVPLFMLRRQVTERTKVDLRADVGAVVARRLRTDVRKIIKSGATGL